MSLRINIAVDAMGGDNAPADVVSGCIAALDGREGFEISLAGREEAIHSELRRHAPRTDYLKSGRLKIKHAPDVIESTDQPTAAIKEKTESSMVLCLRMVKEGSAQAVVSAGNTGALLTGGLLVVGRVKGVLRPALGVLMPTYGGFGYSLLIDAGANMDAKPTYLAQFAHMGAVYVESLFDVKNPRVGLINVGHEEEKGSALVKEAYNLLKVSGLNFTGNLEARELSLGGADVAVCDAFVGNVLLKHSEGMAKAMFSVMKKEFLSGIISKMGAALSKGAFSNVKKRFDASETGGAPLLGLSGLVVKAHGNSDPKAFMNAVWKAVTFVEKGAQVKLVEYFASHNVNQFMK